MYVCKDRKIKEVEDKPKQTLMSILYARNQIAYLAVDDLIPTLLLKKCKIGPQKALYPSVIHRLICTNNEEVSVLSYRM